MLRLRNMSLVHTDGFGMSTLEQPLSSSRPVPTTPRTIGFPRSKTKQFAQEFAQDLPSSPSTPVVSGVSNQGHSPRSAVPNATSATMRPSPAKRAKGRLFIGSVLASVFLGIGLLAWNEFGRFAAYGVMEGRVLHVAAPFAGIVKSLHVRDGEFVTQGQLLASVDSLELQHQIAKTQAELNTAQAALATRRAELQLRRREMGLDLMRSQLDYFQLIAQSHAEKARLAELDSNQQVFAQLSDTGAVSRLEADQNRSAREEQLAKVQTLQRAIQQLDLSFTLLARPASELTSLQPTPSEVDADPSTSMLQLEEAKLQALQEELNRLQEFRRRGEVYAPVAGRILVRLHQASEHVEANAELFRILERGSMEAHVFLTQTQAASYRIDDCIPLQVLPHASTETFRVLRFDDETSVAPTGLSRFYRRDERLVKMIATPIHEPILDTQSSGGTWLGAEVRMPRFTSMSTHPHGSVE